MSLEFRFLLAIVVASAPALLAHNVSPSATFLNQALALLMWGGFISLYRDLDHRSPATTSGLNLSNGLTPSVLALGVLLVAAPHGAEMGMPASLLFSLTFSILAATWVVGAGVWAGAGATCGQAIFPVFAGFLAVAVLSALIAVIQVFLPSLPDGTSIARSGIPGRAVGNLRQPNHLSSVLLWGAVAVIALLELRQLGRQAAAWCLAALIAAVVLTASRTGLLSVLLLALWGVLDRRLSRTARLLLLATPGIYFLAWQGLSIWSETTHQTFGGAARLAETDISGSRFAIWRDTLELIRQQPWLGVGLGNFNFAWSLTPLPHRPTAFFDHAHNLPLHLAAELGVPLATLVVGLLLWGLWRILAAARHADVERGVALRCSFVFLLMIGLHSLLEYPLWYSYFLLPTAWVFGLALGLSGPPQAGRPAAACITLPSWAIRAAGVLMALGAVLAVLDYHRVTVIFDGAGSDRSLEQRIAAGQRSVLFAHHADYAAVTLQRDPPAPPEAFRRTTHYLLDTRLMTAWAESLAYHGRVDQARHLAARLREFRNPASQPFFAACPDRALPAAEAMAQGLPFQCALPERLWTWRDFLE